MKFDEILERAIKEVSRDYLVFCFGGAFSAHF